VTPVGQAGFAATHWSLVLNAGGGDSPQANAALERFCAVYWFPLYAHIRRRGHKPEDACDLTQGSFASLFRRNSLSRVGPEKGRFRTFLLTSLYDFLADQADHRNAARRGSGSSPIELDALQTEDRYALELASGETPDEAFDRRWVCALMERALVRLEHEQTAADKSDHFTRLKPFL
jgi:DNA-directed RNA polymerase specialized sigma24 family protein